MILAEVLSGGFAAAHRNIALILLDLLWKGLWLILTLAFLIVIAWWFGSQIASLEWPNTAIPPVTAWIVATVVRQFWEEHALGMVLAVSTAAAISAGTWLFLESYFRKTIFQRLASETNASPTRSASATAHSLKQGDNTEAKRRRVRVTFAVFLASRFLKLTILATVTLVLGLIIFGSYLHAPLSEWPSLWIDSRAACLGGLTALAALGFLLTVVETLLRIGAIKLLATHLLEVAGLVAILLLFEGTIGVSLMITVAVGLLNAATIAEILFMLVVGGVALLLWNCLHSYLLLVRFSAVDIMSRDVAGI